VPTVRSKQELTKKKYPFAVSFPGIIAVKEDANRRALNDVLSFHVLPGTTLVSGMYLAASHIYKVKFSHNRPRWSKGFRVG